MLSRERVIAVIEHHKPDRVPYYGWLRANLEEPISEKYGSVAAFEDKYEFDFAHVFGGPVSYWGTDDLQPLREEHGIIEPSMLLDVPLHDVNDEAAYENLRGLIDHHKNQRGRFVYCQTPGIFEKLNAAFGIENHLAWLLMYEDDLKKVYDMHAEWNRQFAMNILDLGVDMVHISDDWGAQNGLLFNPDTWWKLIYPQQKKVTEAVKARGAYLSLHSDGNVKDLVDGIMKLGFDVVHPWQESAGMDLQDFKDNYMDRFSVMGGLDVQNTIGFGRHDHLVSEIHRVIDMFRDGGLLYCTTHFIQAHCTMEELELAFDTVYEAVRK